MEENFINDLKNEFSDEIKNCQISSKDLKKLGVSENTLLAEIYLKKMYGEDIIIDEDAKSEVDLTKKKIEKIDLNELEKMTELKTYIENISKSDFDEKLDIVLSKIKNESEE